MNQENIVCMYHIQSNSASPLNSNVTIFLLTFIFYTMGLRMLDINGLLKNVTWYRPILFTTETATRRRRRGRRRRWNWRKSNRIETFRVPPSLRVQVKLSFQFRHARRRCCWSEKILWGILQTKMCEATTWISGVCQEDPRWWVWPQTLHWAIFWLLALCWQMCKCVSAVFLYTPKVSRN
jgi:hypothetical protein